MPTVYRYANREGLYVVSAFRNRIATYQVTPAGQERLARLGLERGGDLGLADFHSMRSAGLIFTNRGGAGLIEMPAAPASAATPASARDGQVLPTPGPTARSRPRPDAGQGAGTAVAAPPWRPEEVAVVRRGDHQAPSRAGTCSNQPGDRVPVGPAFAPSRPARLVPDPRLPIVEESRGGKFFGFVLIFVILDLIGMPCHWIYAVLLSFGVMAGVHAWLKGRFFYRGFLWGQFAGPVGLLVVLASPDVEAHHAGSRLNARILLLWFWLMLLIFLASMSRQQFGR